MDSISIEVVRTRSIATSARTRISSINEYMISRIRYCGSLATISTASSMVTIKSSVPCMSRPVNTTGRISFERLWKESLKIRFDRYDFELASLMLVKRLGLNFVEVPIRTIYIDNNASSHFRPLIDSLRICFVFLRYSLASAVCFALDLMLFFVFFTASSDVFLSTCAARLLSGAVNFYFNKYLVFRSYNAANLSKEVVFYTALAVLVAVLSATLVDVLSQGNAAIVTVTKVMVDVSLFVFNYLLQRYAIFRDR